MAGRMSTIQTLQNLREERERLGSRIVEGEKILSHIRGEIAGIDRAIAMLKGLDVQPQSGHTTEERLTRGALKDAVLGLLVGQKDGLKAIDLIDLARARGKSLDRGSVASLLSRLAKDNVILFDKDTRRYSVKNAVPIDIMAAGKAA